jgi:hypothetical protein
VNGIQQFIFKEKNVLCAVRANFVMSAAELAVFRAKIAAKVRAYAINQFDTVIICHDL